MEINVKNERLVIVGPNDSGKSDIIRAIYLLFDLLSAREVDIKHVQHTGLFTGSSFLKVRFQLSKQDTLIIAKELTEVQLGERKYTSQQEKEKTEQYIKKEIDRLSPQLTFIDFCYDPTLHFGSKKNFLSIPSLSVQPQFNNPEKIYYIIRSNIAILSQDRGLFVTDNSQLTVNFHNAMEHILKYRHFDCTNKKAFYEFNEILRDLTGYTVELPYTILDFFMDLAANKMREKYLDSSINRVFDTYISRSGSIDSLDSLLAESGVTMEELRTSIQTTFNYSIDFTWKLTKYTFVFLLIYL